MIFTSFDEFISKKAAVMYAVRVTSSDTPPCNDQKGDTVAIAALYICLSAARPVATMFSKCVELRNLQVGSPPRPLSPCHNHGKTTPESRNPPVEKHWSVPRSPFKRSHVPSDLRKLVGKKMCLPSICCWIDFPPSGNSRLWSVNCPTSFWTLESDLAQWRWKTGLWRKSSARRPSAWQHNKKKAPRMWHSG